MKTMKTPNSQSSIRSSSSFFSEFINSLPRQKEVSLAIAKDNDEQEEVVSTLKEKGFTQISDIASFVTNPSDKAYLIIDSSNLKGAYDFASQYPTGQIEIFDAKSMKSNLMVPNYEKLSVVFLVNKSDVFDWQKKGVDLLSQVGLTYQSA